MSDSADDLSKTELLSAIRAERARLDTLFASMDDVQMLAPARDDGWTAKDILSHVTTRERRLLTWIQRWRSIGDPHRPEIDIDWKGIDPLNERDYLAAKNTPVGAVRKQAAAAWDSLLAAIDSLSDADLLACPDPGGGPTWSWIIGANTHEHYKEHRAEGRWNDEGGSTDGERSEAARPAR